MLAQAVQPYSPIPSGEIPGDSPDVFVIRPVSLEFSDAYGRRSWLCSDRSNVVFARFSEAANEHETVMYFTHAAVMADTDSLAALNCYLRSQRAMGRMKMPFDRIRHGVHRYAWSAFCEHLGLNFA